MRDSAGDDKVVVANRWREVMPGRSSAQQIVEDSVRGDGPMPVSNGSRLYPSAVASGTQVRATAESLPQKGNDQAAFPANRTSTSTLWTTSGASTRRFRERTTR